MRPARPVQVQPSAIACTMIRSSARPRARHAGLAVVQRALRVEQVRDLGQPPIRRRVNLPPPSRSNAAQVTTPFFSDKATMSSAPGSSGARSSSSRSPSRAS